MKSVKAFLPLLLLCGLLVGAALPAHADDPYPDPGMLGTLEQIADLVAIADHDIPSGQDMHKYAPLFKCMVDGGNSAQCLYDHPLPTDSTIGATLDFVARVIVDIGNQDVGDLLSAFFQYLGDDAVCIIVGIVVPGVGSDLCGLIMAVFNDLVDIGKAVVEVLEDIGKAFADLICDIFGCDDSTDIGQLVYGAYFQPAINSGAALKAEIAGGADGLAKTLGQQAQQRAIQELDARGNGKDYQPSDVADMIGQLQAQFTATADGMYSVWVVSTGYPKVLKARDDYDKSIATNLNSTVMQALNALVESDYAMMLASTHYGLGNRTMLMPLRELDCTEHMWNVTDLGAEAIDYWIPKPQNSKYVNAKSPAMITSHTWCANLVKKYEPLVKDILTKYVPPNCVPEIGNVYCGSIKDSVRCLDSKMGVYTSPMDYCRVDVNKVGPVVAKMIVPQYCTASTTPLPVTSPKPLPVGCSTMSLVRCCNSSYSEHFTLWGQKVIACAPNQAALATQARVVEIAELLRNGGNPHDHLSASQNRGDGVKVNTALEIGNVEAVNPNATQPKTGQVPRGNVAGVSPNTADANAAKANPRGTATGARTANARDAITAETSKPLATGVPHGESGGSTTHFANIAGNDPSAILVDACTFDRVATDKNQDFGFQPPNQPGFHYYSDYNSYLTAINRQVNTANFPCLGEADGFRAPVMVNQYGGKCGAKSSPPASVGGKTEVTPAKPQQQTSTSAAQQQLGTGPRTAGTAAVGARTAVAQASETTAAARAGAMAGGTNPAAGALSGTARTETRSFTEPPPDPQCASAHPLMVEASRNFKHSVAGWAANAPLGQPTPACACGALLAQIHTMDQNSVALMKEGGPISHSLDHCTVSGPEAVKAVNRIRVITSQLDTALGRRKALASQYENQLQSPPVRGR